MTIDTGKVRARMPPLLLRRPPLVTRHLGHPRGLLGYLAGRRMMRGNESLNEWLVDKLAEHNEWRGARIVEVGFGPGLGLTNLLATFPSAQVWGIDQSAVMVRQARSRNIADIRSGRLTLLRGDLGCIADIAPVDLVVAVNVVYFFPDPLAELRTARRALAPTGAVCLGYQLRRHLSAETRDSFGADGHRLFDTDDEVAALLRDAGFREIRGMASGPLRLQLAYA